MENRKILPVKSDVIFRMFYADERNEEFLIGLLKSILRLPENENLISGSPRYHHRFTFLGWYGWWEHVSS